MKKKALLIIGLIVLVIIIVVSLIIFNNQNKKIKPFFLEDMYYEQSKVTEIDTNTFNNLIEKKKSFVIFVYQPMCITSSDFESVLNDLLKENTLSIYKIAFSDIKNTDAGKKVKYYPSFIIYENGKMVDYLEANKDEDTIYYSSKDEFKKWLTKYVNLKNKTLNNNFKDDEKEPIIIPENINLDYIEKTSNKVNIYFFWGDGCPHCADEFKMFERIKEKYGHLYNLYTFETWYNDDNYKLLHVFASAMDDEVKGIPYTIIGSKTFRGFGKNSESAMISAIESEHNKDFDVYFDYLKN